MKYLIILCLFLFSCQGSKQIDKQNTSELNILLLVADDLGYSDVGSYGSSIDTPNLDKLASDGIRFSRYYTAPMCAPTRAMLLSGNDNHIAGMGSQFKRTEYWGYEGYLTDRVVTIPQLLKQSGYHTYIAGKWHLGGEKDHLPPSKGFERSFVLHQGVANHYNNIGIRKSDSTSNYSEDGIPVSWPEGKYSTRVYTDRLIQYIGENHEDGKPFFAFAAYTSPHWPLQVDESFWRKYEGNYDQGYEELRIQRLASLKETGMIPEDADLPPLDTRVEPWDELSPNEQKREVRKMELYSGMVENLDFHIGRLIQFLKEIGEYDRTLIVFMSDNGAASEDFYYNPEFKEFLQSKYDNSYDNMGLPSSFVSYGPQWAEAGSASFKYFKGFTYEGGIAAPMIISGPGIKNKGSIYKGFSNVTDLAPTFYELAGITYPSSFKGRSVYPLAGQSLLPILTGETEDLQKPDQAWVMEHYKHVLVKKDNWKLVSSDWESGKANFELYNLKNNLSERDDLKEQYPEKFQELFSAWEKHRHKYKILKDPF